jgi:integrase
MSLDQSKPAETGAKEVEIPKGGNLYLRTRRSGVETWLVRYRRPDSKKPATLTLGSTKALTLAQARKLAMKAMGQVAAGVDPGAAKVAKREAAAIAAEATLSKIVDDYFRLEGHELRSAKERRGMLDKWVIPALGRKPISQVTRSDITALLDSIQGATSKRNATHIHDILSRVFTWHCVRHDHDDLRSPFVRGMRRDKKPTKRRHVLSDAEIRAFVTACNKWDSPQAKFLLFILFTATRRDEAREMRWGEVSGDGASWLIPASRYKTGIDVLVPLSGAARDVLATCPRIAGAGFVFTLTGKRAISDLTRLKVEIDQRMAVELGAPPAPWRIHDLRRTGRTLMSRAGINSDHAERALGHVIGGVRGAYDVHDFKSEKVHAFEALASLIGLIVNAPTGNVVQINTSKQ